MFIEDDELRELYKVASKDHIEKIEQGLLILEQQPHDTTILNELLRATHSLKGDSRMLGVADAEMLVHQMEDILNEVKNEETILSADLCDRLYSGIDAVKKIAREAVTGEPAEVNTFEVVARLMGAEEEIEVGEEQNAAVSNSFGESSSEVSERYIEDDELRELYRVSSADHLATIERGLLGLEKQPNDPDLLEDLLRATHSLKGDSRMLGVGDAETLVHQIEDILIEVQEGNTVFSAQLCDRLYSGIDAVKKIAQEAVTGIPSGVNAFSVMAYLMGAEEEVSEQSVDPEAETISQPNNQPIPVVASSGEFETVRVGFPKLDALMTQAGELLVTKLRLERRNDDVSSLLGLWEDWNRNFALNKRLFKELEPKLTAEELQKITARDRQERQYIEQFGNLITTLKNLVLEDNARLDTVANKLETGIQNLRLLPLSTVFNLFPRMVRDLGKQLGKEVELMIEGDDLSVDKRILEEIKDPLTHLIRNAIDHGIEMPQERVANNKPQKAKLILRGFQRDSRIGIEIIDDGQGLDTEAIAMTALKRKVCSESELLQMTPQQIQSLIFAPGFSTRSQVSEISGRGVGLDVVRENVERLKGSVSVESTFGMGCKFQLTFNTSLSTTHVLIVEINDHSYAIPIDYVEKMTLVSIEDIFQVEGTPAILWEEKPLSVAWLKDLLKLKVTTNQEKNNSKLPCIILKIGTEKIGIFTDKLINQQNVILKPKSKLISKITHVLGATILSSGEVCMVLNPRELLKSTFADKGIDSLANTLTKVSTKSRVLLVEDSLPIRTQVRRILINAGYDVTVAVDGLEGFNTLQADPNFDIVVSDVEMPNLSGLEMTARIRQYGEYDELPIVLVTTLATDADKRRGAEAGANAYLTKGDFDQTLLLDTLRRLI